MSERIIEKPISINFIKKSPFSGSLNGMRYMFKKADDKLMAYVYPEPFSIDKTPEEKIVQAEFEFGKEGYEAAVDWVNEQYVSRENEWKELAGKLII